MIKVFSIDFDQSIQELKAHDHLALIYESQNEKFDATIAFLEAGFKTGDKCYLLYNEDEFDQIDQQFAGMDSDIDALLKTGQFVLIDLKDTPLLKGGFTQDTLKSFLESLYKETLQSGYSSLRLIDEKGWAIKRHVPIEKLLQYEAVMNDFYLNHEAYGICQYDRKKFPAEIILQILKTHRLVIYKRCIYSNPFYIPPNEFDSSNQAERDVRSMLAELRDLKIWENELVTTVKNLKYLVEINKVISGTKDMDKVIVDVLSNIIDHMNASAAAVLFFDPDKQDLSYRSTRGFLDNYNLEDVHLSIEETSFTWSEPNDNAMVVAHDGRLRDKPSHIVRFQDENYDVYFAYPLVAKNKIMGMLEVYLSDYEVASKTWRPYISVVVNQLANAIDNAQTFQNLQQKVFELTMAYDTTIARFAAAMDKRNDRISRNTQRITEMTENLARKMGASEEDLVHIRRGILLQSIGKMSLPDKILKKPGPLTDNEWDIMHQHPQVVFDLLEDITLLRPALEIPYCHHEYWDGNGYPRGLAGVEIPLSARQFAVVNVYNALLTERPFRPSWDEADAIAYIRSLSGTQFDPDVVDEFLKMLDKGA